MLFKQKPVKGLAYSVGFMLAYYWCFSIFVFILNFWIGILLIVACFIVTLGSLTLVQWFHVYEDHIEVRSIYGKVNEVYFYNVVDIIEIEIPLQRTYIPHYVFDDNRKEKHIEPIHQNTRRGMVRIYVTDELKALLERKGFTIHK